jgi:hypothetical protein
MNWYRQAKLVDTSHPTDKKHINTQCAYCNRWATHPDDPKAQNEKRTWKSYEELDPQEKEEANKANQRINHTSHGLCPICLHTMQKIKDKGQDPYDIDPKEIKALSLGLHPELI